MTDFFLMLLCNVRNYRKPFEQIKSQILTCCLEQHHHQDLFEVRQLIAPKRHTNHNQTRHTINHVDTR